MGRLDDAAKRKVVELRQAGLSFRKIKAVLELENIKVSAQAIYLFLKEFKGKSGAEEAGGGAKQPGPAAPADGIDGAGRQVGWADQQVWSQFRDSSRAPGYASPQDSQQQGGTLRVGGRPPGGAADGSAGRGRMGQQGGRKEDPIRIVSVTSLARGAQHGGPQMAGAGAMMGAGVRRKAPMSPASSAILVARKRLLDKAILHKARMREMSAQPGQQTGQQYERGQACFQGNDGRKVGMLSQTSTVDLTSTRPPQARGGPEPHQVTSIPKRTVQRASPPARSMHPPFQRDPPPCIAVRPPNPAPAPPAGQGHGGAPFRLQLSPNPAVRKEPPPGASQDNGWRGGLTDQMQALGAEIRGLGMAVRLMMEQQSRVEREQAQQTQVQRQILSTLQALASALRPAKTPTPPGPPPYRRDSHTPTRTAYAQCSQQPPLPKYCEIESPGLDSMEAYKLPGLGSPRVNGFQAQASAYTPPYASPHAEAFAQSYGSPPYPAQAQAHPPAYGQTYPETQAQPVDYPAADPLPAANLNSDSPLPPSPDDPQLNIIKVEDM